MSSRTFRVNLDGASTYGTTAPLDDETQRATVVQNLPQPIYVGPTDNVVLQMLSCAVPYSFYGLDLRDNEVEVTHSALGSATLTVPAGNYNVVTFRAAFLLAFEGAFGAGSLAIDYDAVRNQYAFRPLGGITLTFDLTGEVSMYKALGLFKGVYVFATPLLSLTPVVLVDQRFAAIGFHVRGIANADEIILDGAQNDAASVLQMVSVTVPPNSYIQMDSASRVSPMRVSSRVISAIGLMVADSTGIPLRLNGLNWSAALELTVSRGDAVPLTRADLNRLYAVADATTEDDGDVQAQSDVMVTDQ